MRIFTSYFANIRKMAGIVPVSIAQWPPKGYTGVRFPRLAPPAALLREWKSGSISEAEYGNWFTKEILDTLPEKDSILRELAGFGDNIALCCYEKSGSFCHRNLVAARFREIGISCAEWIAPLLKSAPKQEKKNAGYHTVRFQPGD